MARHLIKGHRGLASLVFGTGWVKTQCGMEVPAGNGPDTGQEADCRECQQGNEQRSLWHPLF